MKTVTARLDISIIVECPNPSCNEPCLDLMDADEMGYDLNEDGFLLEQACPDEIWIYEHKKFEVEEVTCPHCKAEFNVKGMEW